MKDKDKKKAKEKDKGTQYGTGLNEQDEMKEVPR